MRIVGVDTSLTGTGLCRVDTVPAGDPLIKLALVKSKATADKSYYAMSARIQRLATSIAAGCEYADLVVIEGPSFNSKGAHTHSRDWLWGKVFDEIVGMGLTINVATPSMRMKYATGKGNASKDAVLAAAIHRWPEAGIVDNNTADATVLAAIGCRALGVPIDTVPKLHWETVIPKLAA